MSPFRAFIVGLWIFAGLVTLLLMLVYAQGPVTTNRAPLPTDPCSLHDPWIDSSVVPRETYMAIDCTPGAAVWKRLNAVDRGLYANRPTSPQHGDIYEVFDLASPDDCTVGGGLYTNLCIWDADEGLYRIPSPNSLPTTCAAGTDCAFTSCTVERPCMICPDGLPGGSGTGTCLKYYYDGLNYGSRWVDTSGNPLPGSTSVIPPDGWFELRWTNGDPPTNSVVGRCDNTAVAGIGTTLTCTGIFATDTSVTDYIGSVTANQGLVETGGPAASTVGLIDCAAGQVLRRNSADTQWECTSRSWMACTEVVNPDATATFDNVMFSPLIMPEAGTATGVACAVESGTVGTAPTFVIEDDNNTVMTHSAPTCAAVGTAATWQAITANAASALVEGQKIRYDVTNSAAGTTTYALCVKGTFP
jgi:hypothetical protein